VEENWYLDKLDIKGGFLEDVVLQLPPGLTCIIGPRGSGKSTLAEALRLGMQGIENASKQRLEIFRFNLSKSVVTVRTKPTRDGNVYTIRREGRQRAILTTGEGKALSAVDLDRGTFLPLDAYSSFEIEGLAEEKLGPKRRTLLDELHLAELHGAQDELSAARRDLEANADEVRAARRRISGLVEQIHILAEARDRLAMLAPAVPVGGEDATGLQDAARQEQCNKAEAANVSAIQDGLAQLLRRVNELTQAFEDKLGRPITDPASLNRDIIASVDDEAAGVLNFAKEKVGEVRDRVEQALAKLKAHGEALGGAHLQQEAAYATLREKNQAAGKAVKERAEAEEAAERLSRLEKERAEAEAEVARLLESRKSLRGRYAKLGERISEIREKTAKELELAAGAGVRLNVRRGADNLEYREKIGGSLHGAGVRNHDQIVESVSKMRPDELAQLIHERNYSEFENLCELGAERSRRVLDAMHTSLEPLELEAMRLEDVISIELNVGSTKAPIYKDASELSRGQKCTALLPLLLARRQTPLVIDQPEDNLDNHFIFRTVVGSIRQLKEHRQMIFITHNANIPVLAEADLIVVMGADGNTGRLEKVGTLDECQQQIVDLLEGGKEAFEKRRLRYERS
jgi:energy-coupling factor transporter ATP-binding protein EcfA2